MNNPYLEEFLLYMERSSSPYQTWDYHEDTEGMNHWDARRECHKKYAYAVPTNRAIEAMAAYSPLIEVGAGGGYWAWCLAAKGADIIVTDIAAPTDNPDWFARKEPWHEVLVMDGAEAVRIHSSRALFLCWPMYDTAMAHEALEAYIQAGGHTLIYVGESQGGCTGDDAFHELVEQALTEVNYVPLPQWYGLHDNLWIYQVNGHE